MWNFTKAHASDFTQQVWSFNLQFLHRFEQRDPNSVCMASDHHLYDMICAINITHAISLISCLVSISYCLLTEEELPLEVTLIPVSVWIQ